MRRIAIIALVAILVIVGILYLFHLGAGSKKKTVTRTVPISYSTVQRQDASMPSGKTAVKQQGKAGTKTITYQQTIKHGKVVSEQQKKTVVTTQPVTQVVAHGTALATTGPSGTTLELLAMACLAFAWGCYLWSRRQLVSRRLQHRA